MIRTRYPNSNSNVVILIMIDKMLLQTVSNHPVHILNDERKFSPSSFIPFCSFGHEFIGAETEEFPIPVCDIFKPKHYFDQLCYETDLQELKDSRKIDKQLKIGLTLVLDYNEERQNYIITQKNKPHPTKAFYHKDDVSIHLDTISSF